MKMDADESDQIITSHKGKFPKRRTFACSFARGKHRIKHWGNPDYK
jgi:regulatory protein